MPDRSAICERIREIGKLIADIAQHQLPGGIGAHALRQALEDRRAELLLEILDLAGQRGGRNGQLFGALADRAAAGDVADALQGLEMLHRYRGFGCLLLV